MTWRPDTPSWLCSAPRDVRPSLTAVAVAAQHELELDLRRGRVTTAFRMLGLALRSALFGQRAESDLIQLSACALAQASRASRGRRS